MTSRTALVQLLAGSGLNFQFSGDRTVIITGSARPGAVAADGVRSGGVINVEGATGNMPNAEMVSEVNGTNGSRDVEATEGTGSYTTGATSIASKIPLTLRETPQAVSVVTQQQIQDQNLNSVRDILERMPGITSTPGGNGEEFQIFSRGFRVDTYTFDGGAPVSFANGNRPVIDMSEFDSVQLQRGAAGLFTGDGSPGGVVNLVRKKPLDHRQITLSQDIGSFDFFREELDVTGPIAAAGKLRGRFVAARQDNDFFYDVANSQKTSIYGVLEYDVTPDTLVTVGAVRNWERNRPNAGGLPRYLDGGAIDFPRSTCLCPSANFDRANRTEVYATLNQKFSDNLSAKINGVYTRQTVDASYYVVSSSIVRGGGNVGALQGYGSYNPSRKVALDGVLNGGFDLFGRHHQFVVGGNYSYENNDGATTTNYPTITVPDIFNFDPDAYSVPDGLEPFVRATRVRSRQFGAYASTRLELMKWLHLIVGVRYNDSKLESTALYSFSPDPQTTRFAARRLSNPAVGATVDFLRNFTLFGTHQEIYTPQTFVQYTPGNKPLPPVTGSNNEIGVKYQAPSKKFNASVSYYRITQNGYISQNFDPSIPSPTIPIINDTKSEGVDVEASGELFPGFQLAASYTYNDNSTRTNAPQAEQRTSFAPKHKAKLWATYRPPSGSSLHRFIVGGGFDIQSKSFNGGAVCATPITDPTAPCPFPVDPTAPFFIPYEFATRGFTTFSAKIGYRLFDNVEVSVVGRNLTNVKAFVSNPGQNPQSYNFYNEPFTMLGSVNVRF